MRNGWTYPVAGVTVLVYIVYIAMAVWTFYTLPPIPEKVVTKSGLLLFTAQDVTEGKVLAQKYGLLDYGSFLGFGGYLMYKYTEPAGLYGVSGINNILPFNVARGLHYNLAVLWIAVSWVSFALFVLPYLGVQLSRARVLAILGAVTALGILLGLWASYLRLLPDPVWFIVGSQRSPVTSQGGPPGCG